MTDTKRWPLTRTLTVFATPFAVFALGLGCSQRGAGADNRKEAVTAGKKEAVTGSVKGAPTMTLSLTSTAFENNGEIPTLYTCQGKDISPPLAWSGVPDGTQSLALVVDDPDAPDPRAPKMTWVHWVLYNIPPTANGLAENVTDLPSGSREGNNNWKRTRYGGPCPPIGRHRYFHKLYALDTVLADLDTPTEAELEKAMEGHILAKVELVGTYQKK